MRLSTEGRPNVNHASPSQRVIRMLRRGCWRSAEDRKEARRRGYGDECRRERSCLREDTLVCVAAWMPVTVRDSGVQSPHTVGLSAREPAR